MEILGVQINIKNKFLKTCAITIAVFLGIITFISTLWGFFNLINEILRTYSIFITFNQFLLIIGILIVGIFIDVYIVINSKEIREFFRG